MNIPSRQAAIALGLDPAVWDAAMTTRPVHRPEPAVSSRASEAIEPGALVVRFVVDGRPRPWRVSIRRKGHGPPTNPKFAAWQRLVRSGAALAMAGRSPYTGLFAFHAAFRVRRHGPQADAGNIGKGALDALQGIVILNDRECRREVIDYDPDSDRDEATIEVVAL